MNEIKILNEIESLRKEVEQLYRVNSELFNIISKMYLSQSNSQNPRLLIRKHVKGGIVIPVREIIGVPTKFHIDEKLDLNRYVKVLPENAVSSNITWVNLTTDLDCKLTNGVLTSNSIGTIRVRAIIDNGLIYKSYAQTFEIEAIL